MCIMGAMKDIKGMMYTIGALIILYLGLKFLSASSKIFLGLSMLFEKLGLPVEIPLLLFVALVVGFMYKMRKLV